MSVDDTLHAHHATHGEWRVQAACSRSLKAVLRSSKNWDRLTDGQREALDMICVKMSRILTGNPNHADSWHDVAGYARLEEKELIRDYGSSCK